MNISSFKVTYIFSALFFSVYVAALQSGHTAFSLYLVCIDEIKQYGLFYQLTGICPESVIVFMRKNTKKNTQNIFFNWITNFYFLNV